MLGDKAAEEGAEEFIQRKNLTNAEAKVVHRFAACFVQLAAAWLQKPALALALGLAQTNNILPKCGGQNA